MKAIQCMPCRGLSQPSPDRSQCMPCQPIPLLPGNEASCNCSLVGGICLPENLGIAERYSPSSKDEIVNFADEEFHSAFFKEHVKVAAYMCYKHKNTSACHLLANLCTMALHDVSHPSCDLIYTLSMRDRLTQIPHLFFSDRMTTSVPTEEDITNVYNFQGPGSRFNITAAQYDLRGHLLSVDSAQGMLFQMCNGSFQEFDAAFSFGTNYLKKCKIPAHKLFNRGEPTFFDLYIPYVTKMADNEEEKLFALPMLLLNTRRNQEEEEKSRWQFTTRFFLVDTISGIPVSNEEIQNSKPKHVRYLSKMKIKIRMLNTREDPKKAGRIYPPIVVIEYGDISRDALEESQEGLDFSFEVNYEMDMKESKKDIETVDVIHLIVSQITVDIFLLDWERPKAVSSSGTHGELTKEEAVSVWRTYLVANEWNELQVRRKTNVGLQIIILILLFQVIGLEHYATADPKMSLSFKDGEYHSQYSFVCRFALAVVIYMGVALIQALFWTLIYAGVVENKMEQFADVCSLSNISVFILAANNFGYYIHGKKSCLSRSAHGSADTDMATLIEQLQREADDRCPHRGLQAQTDDQSFTMTLPTKLKSYYDKIVTPATDLAGIKGGPRISKLSGNAIQHMVEAYSTMNKFLTRFLEHALKDLDYEIKDKFVLEKILDVEFQDVNITEKAIFYADSGHSFDAVLFYGNEFSLLTFDMMVFIFVDLFAEDFVLAGVVTFFAAEVCNAAKHIII
eukprot:TCALIF_11646-PA protein Name:"Similar to Tmem67 Meckelin (Rattus norvegicus)" AED:0.11 eAED:0.11 QI:708/0.75/0.55/1/1/1/9/0/735